MNLFQFWACHDTQVPIAIIFGNDTWDLDNAWTWEGTAEELYADFGDKLYSYTIIQILKDEYGYTIYLQEDK